MLTAGNASAPITVAEGRVAMAGYAACIVARQPTAVAAMLARPYDDLVSKTSKALHDPSCPYAAGSTVYRSEVLRGFDGLGFRAALFQAVALRDRATIAANTAPVFPGDDAFPSGRMWPGSPAANYREYIGMGECVMKRDSMGARALVMTDPETADEQAAVASIARAFGKCGWSTKTLTLARGSLSEILYRAAQPAGVR